MQGTTLAVGALGLGILLPLRFLAPRVPAALLVVVGASLALGWLDLVAHGVAVVGTIPSGLPELAAPSPTVEDTLTLLLSAAGIFLVCFADAILTARSFAGKNNEHIRVDQELLAMGAAQAAAGLTQSLSLGASGSRTAVNDAMGARTQVAGLLSAATVVVVLLFLTGPIADLPKAVLGAVIVSAAVGLVEPAAWRQLWETDRVELAIAAVTTAGVVAVGCSRRSSSRSDSPSSTWSDAARDRTMPYSGGWSGSGDGRTSRSIASRALSRASSSTDWTTASSSPTRATSRPACEKRSIAHPRPRTISCSTPKGSPTSTAPGMTLSATCGPA